MWNCFQEQNSWERVTLFLVCFLYWFPFPVSLLQCLSMSCWGLAMDEPNSVLRVKVFARNPQAEWCAKQNMLIFLLPSPICAHATTHRDTAVSSCTAGARQHPWWLCCPEEGVEDSGGWTTGGWKCGDYSLFQLTKRALSFSRNFAETVH